jgi:predicted PurR-regulated permease PerM
MSKSLTKPFLLILVLFVLIGCYLVFKPVLTEMLVAVILVSVFYRPYELLAKTLKGRRNLAALLMCLFLLLVIVVPLVKGIIYAGEKSVTAYSQTVEFFNHHDLNDVFKSNIFQHSFLNNFDIIGFSQQHDGLKNTILNFVQSSSNWLISGAGIAVKETTNFVVSLLLIILTMFFFFVDGKKMLEKLMLLSPLPDKYDIEIFQKFRAVSYTTFISTFVTAIAQGAVGAIGFAIVGFPPFLAGVLIAILSLIPYIGSAIFYIPVGVYYFLTGDIWQGAFVILWGSLVVGTIDNIIRAYMIKGKAEVNPIFVLISILGGISLFGFWGVVLGPLIIAIAASVLHIYELEFCEVPVTVEDKEFQTAPNIMERTKLKKHKHK